MMKLEQKFALINAVIILLLIIILMVLSEQVILHGFESLEDQQIADNLGRITETVEARIDTLAISAVDYAEWDDTYYFVENQNEAYIESNFYYGTFENLNINFFIILDAEKNVVYAKSIDLEYEETYELSSVVLEYILSRETLTDKGQESVKGLITIEGLPVIYSKVNIVDSEGKKESNGQLIMGRFLDTNELEAIENIVKVDLEILKTNNDAGEPIVKRPEAVIGTTLFDGVDGSTIKIQATMLRNTYNEGERTLTIFFVGSILLGLLFILSVFLTSSFIFRRTKEQINALKRSADAILENTDNNEITANTHDEVGELAQSFNLMQKRLKNSRKKLEHINRNLEKKIRERTKELEKRNKELNKFNALLVGRELKMIELKKQNKQLAQRLDNRGKKREP